MFKFKSKHMHSKVSISIDCVINIRQRICIFFVYQTIFIYSIFTHKPLHYEDYDYPDWADGLGWCLACLSMFQIPFWAIVVVVRSKGSSLKQVCEKSPRS